MKKILIIAFVFLFQFGFSQSTTSFFTKADAFFKANVSNGKVNYKQIKEDPDQLNELLDLASTISVSVSDSKVYQAFYINAYNLSVIKGIVNKYPVNSPTSISGFFDGIKYTVASKKVTLNDIENKFLRKVFPKEPRFHFALVCAGLGCPPIISNAYKPSTLEAQLQQQTEKALNNPSFIRDKGKKVLISQIFEWYKKDFTQFGSLLDFINKYRTQKIPEKTKIGYYTYDWSLNKI